MAGLVYVRLIRCNIKRKIYKYSQYITVCENIYGDVNDMIQGRLCYDA